jgi:hypothetical protein
MKPNKTYKPARPPYDSPFVKPKGYAASDTYFSIPEVRYERQTIERVVEQGYFKVPKSDPETALLKDRQDTTRLSLDDAIQQIRERLVIYRNNMYELEQGKCHAMNDLFAWEAMSGGHADQQEHYILGKRMQQLYGEQRAERVSLWRDVSRIRQALPENAQRYLSAYRKMQILGDNE